MSTHDLKVWPEFYAPLERGDKLFEVRKADRDFKVGDWLKLREWAPPDILKAIPGHYTGARCLRRISYVLTRQTLTGLFSTTTEIGLAEGFVILGLFPPITDLSVNLQGKRLFLGSISRPEVRAAQQYLAALQHYLDAEKARVRAAADKKPS